MVEYFYLSLPEGVAVNGASQYLYLFVPTCLIVPSLMR